MRRVLVVCESMFGNTRAVADAVADGLRVAAKNGSPSVDDAAEVQVCTVSHAPRDVSPDVDLIVVGGPTHAFSMSRPSTRKSAAEQGADPAAATHDGIREWIASVKGPDGLRAAVFDTKVQRPHLPGSAAKAARRRLRSRGFATIDAPKTFYVTGTQGDLVDGELDRARQWGVQLAKQR